MQLLRVRSSFEGSGGGEIFLQMPLCCMASSCKNSLLLFAKNYRTCDRSLLHGNEQEGVWENIRVVNVDAFLLVIQIIQDKRSVVLPEPTLSERIGTVKASTTKVCQTGITR